LVPNTVLQKQWKDKINKFFIEKNENIDELVSFELDKIKKVNILTYQSISQQDRKKSTKNNKVLTDKVLKYFDKIKNI
jgi:superfamily II DNA or RNA helicase